MLSKIEIEKYKMLLSAVPEDKANEAAEMLKEAMRYGHKTSTTLPKVNKFVMQNASIYIVRDEKEIERKDLTKYDLVMFDCDVKEVTDFSNCPKKMIFNKSIKWAYNDFYQLPDLSGSLVCGSFYCGECENLTSLKGAPEKVGGTFYCGECENLTSLKGAPKEVGGDFGCGRCYNLTSLEGAPKEVGGDFGCGGCYNLTSLEGAPKEVGGYFSCYGCSNLKSLDGAPKEVGGDFRCGGCCNLTSLEGAPKEVGGYFSCIGCPNLTSLEGAPKEVGGDFVCRECINLKSLKGVPEKIGGDFDFVGCNVSLRYRPKYVGGYIWGKVDVFGKIMKKFIAR